MKRGEQAKKSPKHEGVALKREQAFQFHWETLESFEPVWERRREFKFSEQMEKAMQCRQV